MDQAVTTPGIRRPAVSVVMSCFNAAAWLGEAVDSVLAQTMADFEFITVDDGSTDDTARILEACAARDARLQVVRKPSTGLGDSLNVGIAKARGAWVARLDADDLCAPDRLERQLALARSDATLVFVGSGLVLIDDQGRPSATHRYPADHDGLVRCLQQVGKFPAHSSALIRTEALRRAGGYRTRIRRAQDWDLWLRLSTLGRLACVDAPLVRIRKHAGQVSHEESGDRQVLDARIGLVSYWIRRLGGEDPVGGTEEGFAAFRAWTESRLTAAGLFRVAALGRRAAAAGGTLGVAGVLARQPLDAARLLWTRWAGEHLAARLAREWLAAPRPAGGPAAVPARDTALPETPGR